MHIAPIYNNYYYETGLKKRYLKVVGLALVRCIKGPEGLSRMIQGLSLVPELITKWPNNCTCNSILRWLHLPLLRSC